MKEFLLTDSELDRCEETIVRGIRAFVKDAGVKGAVVALSGGIDSALVCALGRYALGNRIQALILPVKGVTSEEDVKDASGFAEDIGLSYRIIGIGGVLDTIKKAFPEISREREGFLARANLAPRIRMVFNYMVSNMEDLVVLGTGNKTELMLGYYTKYGDGGVDFLPIGDMYKTHVKQMACRLDIPACITEKVPSAGLWHGQTDEEELGASYADMDRMLYLLYVKGFSPKRVASQLDIGAKTVRMIMERVENNRHKRSSIPLVELGRTLNI